MGFLDTLYKYIEYSTLRSQNEAHITATNIISFSDNIFCEGKRTIDMTRKTMSYYLFKETLEPSPRKFYVNLLPLHWPLWLTHVNGTYPVTEQSLQKLMSHSVTVLSSPSVIFFKMIIVSRFGSPTGDPHNRPVSCKLHALEEWPTWRTNLHFRKLPYLFWCRWK